MPFRQDAARAKAAFDGKIVQGRRLKVDYAEIRGPRLDARAYHAMKREKEKKRLVAKAKSAPLSSTAAMRVIEEKLRQMREKPK